MPTSTRRPSITLAVIRTVDYYVCKVCGNTIEGEPHGPCPVCQAGPVAFFKVDLIFIPLQPSKSRALKARLFMFGRRFALSHKASEAATGKFVA